MSSKRAKAREWKQKQQQVRRIWIGGGIAAGVIILVLIGLFVLDLNNQGYIAVFDGKKISVEDLKFMRLFTTSEETDKADAMDQLATFLVIEKAAKDAGVVLTAEEEAEAASYSEGILSYFSAYALDTPNLSNKRLTELMSLNFYYDRLLDINTADYVVDEADFATALADYKENKKIEYIDTQLKYLFTEDQETAEAALNAINDGMPIDEAIATFSVYYDEAYGVELIGLRDLNLDEEKVTEIMALEAGDMTGVYDLDGTYVLFFVDSITIPTDEELHDSYREQYIDQKKNEAFEPILTAWKDSADIKVNQRAYDKAW